MHKKIIEHLNEAVLFFDRRLKLTYINTAGEMLFADSARHLLGSSAEDLFKTIDSDQRIDLEYWLRMDEPLVDREMNLEIMNQSITVNFSATPIVEDDKVAGIIVELQQLDRHIRISKEEQLLAQQTTVRMLVRGLAHEIKNPLGGLRGAAQLLDLELDDPELKEYTQIIIAESDRLQTLVDKMLGPNRLPNKSLLNIHEVVERVRQLVLIETSGKLTVKQDYDPSIPEVFADKNQLIQAVLNIVRNAVQAMEGSGILTLRTRVCRQLTIGRKRNKLTAKIEIIDNGPGIDKEMMSKIFYPMITGRAEGTGLGLSIAQSLINQHEGMIECDSQPGHTVFSIYLPLENHNE